MDLGQSTIEVLSSGAVVTATYHIVKGLKSRLSSLERIACDQSKYIDEIRTDFKELSTIKTDFIREIQTLSFTYQEHAKKTYGGIIAMKDTHISELTEVMRQKPAYARPTKSAIQKHPDDLAKKGG